MTHFVIDQQTREALTKEKADSLLAPVLPGTVSIKLSGKSFGTASAPVAAAALRRAAPTLTHLDLSDIIASRPEEEAKQTLATITAALSSCKTLHTLDLSDNALGAKGIVAVRDLLVKQPNLSSLTLHNNGLAADAGHVITSALQSVSPSSLQTLRFHNNLLETAGADALLPVVRDAPKLEHFRFSSTRLARDGAVRLTRALAPRLSSTLRSLNLSDNAFGDEGAAELAIALADAPTLEKLIIADVMLGDDGARNVCDVLAEGAPRLEELDVSANEMGPEAAKGLARLLAVGRLRVVRAEDNELGNAGASILAKGLAKCVTLASLDVCGSEIGSRGALALAKAAKGIGPLSELLIDRNAINEDTVAEMQELLGNRLGSLDDNDEDGEEDEDEDEDDEDGDDLDEINTDMAAKSGNSNEHAGVNGEAEVDELMKHVESLKIHDAA